MGDERKKCFFRSTRRERIAEVVSMVINAVGNQHAIRTIRILSIVFAALFVGLVVPPNLFRGKTRWKRRELTRGQEGKDRG